MPAPGNIVINDGATTPVAHTFKPISRDANGVVHYADQSGGVPIGYARVTINVKQAPATLAPGSTAKSTVNRVRFKIEIPVLEVTSPSTGSGIQPAPTVAYTTMASLEFVIPTRTAELDRKHILAYAKNLLSATLATDLVVNSEALL